jgi:predicted RNase H-like HicB family nuclease
MELRGPALKYCLDEYGATADEAVEKAQALALRVLAARIEHRESPPAEIEPLFSIHHAA